MLYGMIVDNRCESDIYITNVKIKQTFMLTTIAIILLVLWLLGVVSGASISGFINILLVIAIVLFLLRIIRGENPFK